MGWSVGLSIQSTVIIIIPFVIVYAICYLCALLRISVLYICLSLSSLYIYIYILCIYFSTSRMTHEVDSPASWLV